MIGETRPLNQSLETRPLNRHRGPAGLGLALFVVAAAAALTIDIPRAGYGVKSDEATYVAATLSAAYDGNFTFERQDLERFEGLYHSGPEGIFLKRGRAGRLYFAKSMIYPFVAAPFVRVFGLNGMLLLHVLLLGAVVACGYAFLAEGASTAGAALFTAAFVGASVVPVYAVFLLPEILTFTLVFGGYFFWAFKQAHPGGLLNGRWTDIVAAALLGLATYAKPTNGLLVAPFVLFLFWRRQWTWGLAVGMVAVVVAAAGYGLNAAVTGDINYQGGDRKTFYNAFPFDTPDATWERRGLSVATSGEAQQEVLTSGEVPVLFAHNIVYFLVGRHFGFLPYFFPGAVAIGAWLLSRRRRDAWRLLAFLAFSASALGFLVGLPYTWSGGGGPPGNRYLLNFYPTLFFLMPGGDVAASSILAWLGGALFTAKMLVNPLVAAKFPYLMSERGPARRLPIELTMVHDLPLMLDAPARARIPYGHDPAMFLYFLDENAWPPEPSGMWIAGGGRADVIVRTADPIDRLLVTAESPINTTLTMTLGGAISSSRLAPGKPVTFTLKAGRPVHYVRGWVVVMSAQSSDGFVPHLFDPKSPDYRNLGVRLNFSAVNVSSGTPSPR